MYINYERIMIMYITSISLSYIFLGISLISLSLFFYFKIISLKTSFDDDISKKIIGTIKKPNLWKRRNSIMAYISLLWSIVSIVLFIYLKFFFDIQLVSILYLFTYISLICISMFLIIFEKKILKWYIKYYVVHNV